MKSGSINGGLCILISTVKRGSAEISNRVSRKMRLHRDPSIAGENSINFELNFQILSDDRGPGPGSDATEVYRLHLATLGYYYAGMHFP